MRDLQLELCNCNLTANLATLLEVCMLREGEREVSWIEKIRTAGETE